MRIRNKIKRSLKDRVIENKEWSRDGAVVEVRCEPRYKAAVATVHLAETDLVNAENSCTEVHVGFERLMDLIMSMVLTSDLAASGSSGVACQKLPPRGVGRGSDARFSCPLVEVAGVHSGVVVYSFTRAATDKQWCPLPQEPKPLAETTIAISSRPTTAPPVHDRLPV